MTIKSSLAIFFTSLCLLARLVVVFSLIVACKSMVETTPDNVAAAFWQAVIAGNLESAQSYVMPDGRSSLAVDQDKKYTAVKVGAMTLEGDSATVVTRLRQGSKDISFNTALIKESGSWKVDYQQTRMNISLVPFHTLVNELQDIGETFGEQVQQQVPLIEKGLQKLGKELNRQLEDFNRTLEQQSPAPTHKKSNHDTL